MIRQTQYLIIGAGVMGLTIARELLARGADRISILEKEKTVGVHASGRNSGVLHAGIYYPENSLKAKFCLEGNRLMQAYCESRGLHLLKTGKVIVAREEAELSTLKELERRARSNGARVEMLDEQQLSEVEPYAKTTRQALYSPETAVVDPQEVMQAFYQDLQNSPKVEFLFSTAFSKRLGEHRIQTSAGEFEYQTLVNAAGAYADRVAHQFDVGKEYCLLPFKGLYKKLSPEFSYLVRGNIYPVPNIHHPFLGTHFTRSAHQEIYLGPTAIPAFGRENYGVFQGIDGDFASLLFKEARLFLQSPAFRSVALTEPRKYFSSYFFREAQQLVKALKPEWLLSTSKVGIRPQLVNWSTKTLEMDFVLRSSEGAVHILNAISPAFTSSLAFSRYIVDEYLKG